MPMVGDPGEVTWINVTGVSKVKDLEKLGECFKIHPLVLEDILEVGQRPKVEDYDDYLYIVLNSIRPGAEGEELVAEEISLVLGPLLPPVFLRRRRRHLCSRPGAAPAGQRADPQAGGRLSRLCPHRSGGG